MNDQLKAAYLDALNEQLDLRKDEHHPQKSKQHLTPFDMEVAECIFNAGLLAIQDRQRNLAQYRVVSAPTGSGKSSFAQAFIKAYITVFPDPSVLYLVETIDHAEDVYHQMSALLGDENVAVWTSAHDLDTSEEQIERKHGFVPFCRFGIDDLASYPVVIVTHKFYQGRRANKAVKYKGQDRKLIFVDEKMADVTLYDVDTGLIKMVRDQLAEQHTSNIEHVPHLTKLHDHMESVWQSASSKQPYDTVPTATDLSWFLTHQAADAIATSDENAKNVFGFGRALAKGFAFLSRYDQNGKGARFVGYEVTTPLRPGTILLDATADIDGVSLITNNRHPVPVPRVDFRNLAITHIEPPFPKRTRISQIVKTAKDAKPYADWIMETVLANTEVGEKVLVVVHKALIDLGFLPNFDTFDLFLPDTIRGREICFINWGMGIGSNRWKDASAVFLFGDFHLPKRALVGTALGLKQQRADKAALAPFQSPKSKASEFLSLRDGHLCRHQKQLAMRGNARNISWDGVCGVQRLYVTGEFSRLIRYKDQLFPGATVTVNEPEKRLQQGGIDALIGLLYQAPGDAITTTEVKEATGIDLQKNKNRYLSSVEVKEAMSQNGWVFVQGKGGRGNVGRFVKAASQAA
jgi:hypothetical protein